MDASDAALRALAGRFAERALAGGLHLVTAESCTGGWIAKIATDLPGSSRWFDGGYVTYSNAAKERTLGVLRTTLEAHGAVSEAVVREMVAGALRASGAELAVAVSGVAGPDGGTEAKPVGTVWFAVGRRADTQVFSRAHRERFGGDREAVRRATVRTAFELLLAE